MKRVHVLGCYLGIVEMFFSKAASHRWGFDDMGKPGVAIHISVPKNTKTAVSVALRGVPNRGLNFLSAGSEFSFSSADDSIASVKAPDFRGSSFEVEI
jgi:hypothetical protein